MRELVIENLRKTLGGNEVLKGVSLGVKPGELVALLGQSGSGKTTILRAVAGLEPPDSGRIVLGDQVFFDPAQGVDVPPEKRGLGLVFQSYALWPNRSVFENVAYGLKLRGVAKADRKPIVDQQLEMVNLTKFDRAYIHELSGGMKQRVQLARALAVEPHMLMMDEPFAALDAQTRDDLQLELQGVAGRIGATVLFVTHNVREAVILGDRVIVMSKSPGRIRRIIDVPLSRPRTPDDHDVADFAAMVRAELQEASSEPRYAI